MSSQERWSQLTAALLEMRQNVLTLEQQIKSLDSRVDALEHPSYRAVRQSEIVHVQS